MKNYDFNLRRESGLSWLMVAKSTIKRIGMTEADFSPRSRMNGDVVALDEFSDVGRFIETWEAAMNRPARIKEVDSRLDIKWWNRFGTNYNL